MAKKKVVDAEILLDKIQNMSHRQWCFPPYYSGAGYGGNNLEDALRNAGQLMTAQITQNINSALQVMLMELKMAIEVSTRDEDGGMCGLCRINPDEVIPTDYRTK